MMETGTSSGYIEEQRRILELVADRRITVEDADRLLAALDPEIERERCPYCAEEIVAGLAECPECRSPLGVYPMVGGGVGGFASLAPLAKGLVVYMVVVCAIVILSNLTLVPHVGAVCRIALAGLGGAAVVWICRGQRLGWVLAMWWSALQIVEVYLHYTPINRQVFGLSFSVGGGDGTGLGINIVAIVLLLLIQRAWADTGPERT